MSMPLTWGARKVVVRLISRGEFTPSWAIVGVGEGDVVKSVCGLVWVSEGGWGVWEGVQ